MPAGRASPPLWLVCCFGGLRNKTFLRLDVCSVLVDVLLCQTKAVVGQCCFHESKDTYIPVRVRHDKGESEVSIVSLVSNLSCV